MTRQQRQGLIAAALAFLGLILVVFAEQITKENEGLVRAMGIGTISGAIVTFALAKRRRL